jgi:hypothetical protein
MKRNLKIMHATVVLGLVFACKQSPKSSENAAFEEKITVSDTAGSFASSAAVVDLNSKRKFVRTADIKFKVKNVTQSTYAIEDATSKFGGFVTSTNLESNIYDENTTKISVDSTLVITKYKVENNITIRVPNAKLDTVLKIISKQVHFLNYRRIKADDVSLQIVSNELAQKRSTVSEKRLENAINAKGKKLKEIGSAEENLYFKKEQNDLIKIQNLSLNDQIDLSTVTFNIYQDESIMQEMIANEKSSNFFRPNVGLQILDSLKTGWLMLENIVLTVVKLWPILFLGLLGYFSFKKLKRKQS